MGHDSNNLDDTKKAKLEELILKIKAKAITRKLKQDMLRDMDAMAKAMHDDLKKRGIL
jgi:hypothetical protein